MIGGQSSLPDYASHFSSINEENFWPSFTDIMMVVVIVFLLSSTVAILHNWDLSRQVQETAALEQQARERAEDLNLRQMLLQLELGEMQARMEKTREALQAKSGQLEAREEDLAGAQTALAEQQTQLMNIQEEHARVQTEMRESQTVSAEREEELLEVQEQLAQMQDESVLREQMYVEVEKQQRQTREELELLQKEYEQMGEKYAALSKPARSPLGKVVAAVRYRKVEGQPSYMFKPPDAPKFEPIGEEEMHQVLSGLKQEHGDKLFVRIVIPMDSNLTYQEGWQFSLDLLRRYDYYYAD
ncbi:MAG: hypothetical protein OXC38_03170 [Gammaproteobacteria bacterium]|nr:hypothetical protein [Gammaproteobacteria bacterium]